MTAKREARKGLQPNRDFAGAAEVIKEKHGNFGPPKTPKMPPGAINLESVGLLRTSYTFTFRHSRYTVARLPWYSGIELEFIRDEITRVMVLPSTREHMEYLAQLFERGFTIMWIFARGKGWWFRGRWRNEFKDATYAEFSQLASFFSECQMLLPNLALDTTPGSLKWRSRSPSISRTALPSLSKRSRAGAERTDSRSAMSIIGSGSAGSK